MASKEGRAGVRLALATWLNAMFKLKHKTKHRDDEKNSTHISPRRRPDVNKHLTLTRESMRLRRNWRPHRLLVGMNALENRMTVLHQPKCP